jgi:hypothetical protein
MPWHLQKLGEVIEIEKTAKKKKISLYLTELK